MKNSIHELKVIELNPDTPMSLRNFDASTGLEQTEEWDVSCLERIAAQVRADRPRDGDIVHCVAYHKVHRCPPPPNSD